MEQHTRLEVGVDTMKPTVMHDAKREIHIYVYGLNPRRSLQCLYAAVSNCETALSTVEFLKWHGTPPLIHSTHHNTIDPREIQEDRNRGIEKRGVGKGDRMVEETG